MPILGEEETRFGDFIEDESSVFYLEAASLDLLKNQIDEVLCTITPKNAGWS